MKKTFQMIGLISLTIISFYINEKISLAVKDMDEIMISIKENQSKYNSDFINAEIIDNEIIPGICSKKVNISKSYKNMKKYGYYNDKYYIYDYEYPKISLKENINKYITGGNKNKRMVSFVFKIYGNDNIYDVLKILDNYGIKAVFFVDEVWFTNNNELVSELISKGHEISALMDDYSSSNFEWMNMVIKNINKQNNTYCYNVNKDDNNLNQCVKTNSYTVMPIEISSNTPLVDIKNRLISGGLYTFKINSNLKRELSSIIIYIKSKGYLITNFEENVLE